ncbi:3-oxo-5-alpha-steroid 4-dehydrogenase 1 [Cichlidogyrus casuarinus]|uniref:3-oxo-5-alpha-steroid 4-dehydrogenase 1 n=1 Tax=Cichlidogyrus casuarinus TaxID=1844966 RepID=A0ABD2PP84_9PLAT
MDSSSLYLLSCFVLAGSGVLLFLEQQIKLFIGVAGMGKLKVKSKANSLSVDPKLGWCLQELPSFVIPFWTLVNSSDAGLRRMIPLLLMSVHYFNRAIIYPFSQSSKNRLPAVYFCLALSFTTFNGFLQSHPHSLDLLPDHPLLTLAGSAIFVLGMYYNLSCDRILVSLKKRSDCYKIPQGGLFNYVSAANYSAEVLEWFVA